jgi:biotin carboxylase
LPGDARENIIFIGLPIPIYKMGKTMPSDRHAHKIPCFQKGNVRNERSRDMAEKIGYPVILKAASGGGGRGMRIVENAAQIEKMFKMATGEAEKAFNDPSVFLEK